MGAALIGAMGAVLTSSFFTLPNEIEKYKQTLTLDKQHNAYNALLDSLHQLLVVVHIMIAKYTGETKETVFDYKAEEYEWFLEKYYMFDFTYSKYILYFPQAIQQIINQVLNLKTDIDSAYNQPSKEYLIKNLVKVSHEMYQRFLILESMTKDTLEIEK